MASNQEQGGSGRHAGGGNGGRNAAARRAPEWADGLKQLYDSVVEEDLPDSFKDLLDRLDGSDPALSSNDNGAPPQSPDGRGTR
ncbi:MAG: NepR family anti-sigma factor [Erythrobacter sp.]|nr:NepR family anti-sigma factor [Erythrobacter sp.]